MDLAEGTTRHRTVRIGIVTGEDLLVRDGYIVYENGMALVSSPTGSFHLNTNMISIVSFEDEEEDDE